MRSAISLLMLVLFSFGPAAPGQVRHPLPETFTAFAVSTGGPYSRAVATSVELRITRWSTPDESRRLMQALRSGGSDEMLDTLQDLTSVGTIQTPGSLAYDLRYAQEEYIGDGIRRIVLATDRPISMWEAVNRPRSIDYPFTFIELRLNERGEGEGKLALATRIDVSRNGRLIELENYATQPIHLNEVRREAR